MKLIKPFNPFASKKRFGCKDRLSLNVYLGCFFRCRYCYTLWSNTHWKVKCKEGFKDGLKKDIEEIKKKGLSHLLISISNSTEPLQPLEYKYRHTLFALKTLAEAGLKGVIITKNPSLLLDPLYLKHLSEGNFIVQVTVPFIKKNVFEPFAPPPSMRLFACKNLIKNGIKVILRIDPLVPNVDGIGQKKEEILTLLSQAHDVGIEYIIAKCLRLLGAMKHYYPSIYKRLLPFYKRYGHWIANAYELKDLAKEQLLSPIYEESVKRRIKLFTCIDKVSFGSPCDPCYFLLSS